MLCFGLANLYANTLEPDVVSRVLDFGKLTVKLEWIRFTWDVMNAEAPYRTDTLGWNWVGEWCVFKLEDCY